MENKEMLVALIRDARIGCNARKTPGLLFTVDVQNGYTANLMLDWEQTGALVRQYDISDVRQLNGTTCWVRMDENETVQFVDLWRPQLDCLIITSDLL